MQWRGLGVAMVLPVASSAARAQRLGGAAAAPDLSVERVLAALVLCIAAAFALAVLVRRRGGGLRGWSPGRLAASRRIRVIETRRASAHADLCLIDCDGEEYLLLCGPAAQTVLRTTKGDGA